MTNSDKGSSAFLRRINFLLSIIALPLLAGCPGQGNGTISATISGHVTGEDGAGVSGVVIAANNGATTSITDASGKYQVQVPFSWSGVLTPIHTNMRFEPASRNYQVVISDLTDQNLLAHPSADPDSTANNKSIQVDDPSSTTTQDHGVNVMLSVQNYSGNADLTFSIVDQPAHGTLGPVDNSATSSAVVTYTPASGYVGADSFTFRATDGTTTSNTGTVSITINATIDVPVISPSPQLLLAVQRNSQGTDPANRLNVSATATGVTDLDWTIVTPPSHGTAQIVSGSSGPPGTPVVISYEPTTGYSGVDSFGLRVHGLQNAFATVNVGVDGFPISGTIARVITGGGTQNLSGVGLTFTGAGGSAGQNFSATTDSNGQYSVLVTFGWNGNSAVTDSDNWVLTPSTRHYTSVSTLQTSQDYLGGRNYYVATTASGSGAGTKVDPFQTIQAGANASQPGDTVYVRGGTYTEQVHITGSGRNGTPISIAAYPGETAIVDGQNTRASGFLLDNSNYITVSGFEIKNWTSYGVDMEDFCDNCTIKLNTIHDGTGPSIYLRGGDNALLSYNEMYNCYNGVFTNWRDTNSNFIQGGVIQYNIVHDMAGGVQPDGISAIAFHDGTIENNLVWNSGDDGIDNSAPGGITETNQPNAASVRNILRFNCCWNNHDNGIKTSTNAGGSHTIHHNICFGNTRCGFDNNQVGNWGANRFYNNTAYANGNSSLGGGIALDMNGVTNLLSGAYVRNNIFYGNGTFFHDYKRSTPGIFAINKTDHNDIGDNLMQIEELLSIHANPLFVNAGGGVNVNYVGGGGVTGKWTFIHDQVIANFALQNGSPCIDAAAPISGITDGFHGLAPDIGASEH